MKLIIRYRLDLPPVLRDLLQHHEACVADLRFRRLYGLPDVDSNPNLWRDLHTTMPELDDAPPVTHLTYATDRTTEAANVLNTDPIVAVTDWLEAWLCVIEQRTADLWCRIFGHRIQAEVVHPESGGEDLWCERCGWNVTVYH